ncbi:hypothetical protein IL306_010921 [Fusarium sp. DS 682]|nr:hypothetical protein IL306_010921 [Fusarium sp. DS 682]
MTQTTVLHAVNQEDMKKGKAIDIISLIGLGVLVTQLAKAWEYRVVAIDNHEVGLKPSRLQPDLILRFGEQETIQRISDFPYGIGLGAAIVCTSDEDANY